MNNRLICVAAIASLFSAVAAQEDVGGIFLPAGLVPVFENPGSGGLPRSYLEPTDTCRGNASFVDSSGTVWVSVVSVSASGWVRESSLRAPAAPEAVRAQDGERKKMDADAKRRYRILEQNPDWPRRIVRSVREGKICLDMNEDQLAASWGAPAQKSRAFILGAGSYELWYYKAGDGTVLAVFLVRGRVAGWTEQ